MRILREHGWLIGLVVASCGCSDDTDAGGANGTPCDPGALHSISYGPQDDTFFIGPYLMHTTQTSVALSWETEHAGSTKVEYGTSEALGQVLEGEPGTLHQVTIEGLEAGARYRYRACTDDQCTGLLAFSTAPSAGKPFRFVTYGDSRSNPDAHAKVAANIVAEEPAVVVNVGDIVGDGRNREEYKPMHFDPTRRLGHYAPIYVAMGNHEKYGEPFLDYMMFPSDPNEPLTEFNYTFQYGDVFFLAMDSTSLFYPSAGFEPPTWTWLVQEAGSKASRASRFRFAFFHYPPASVCEESEGDSSMRGMRDHVLPLLRENGFHGIFVGHVHDYERMDFDGQLVVIAGGGGAPLEDPAHCTYSVPESRVFKSVHHHVTVDVGCDEATVRAVDVDGNTFDQVAITRDGRHHAL